MGLQRGLNSGRVVVVEDREELGLVQEAQRRQDVSQRRADEDTEDLAAIAASQYAPRFDPVQEVRATQPKLPSWVQGDDKDVRHSGQAIRRGIERALKQDQRYGAAKDLGIRLPEQADVRRWQGATNLQRAQSMVAVDRFLRGDQLKGTDDALQSGFVQCTKAMLGPSLIFAADKVEKMALAGGQACDVLLGIEQRKDNHLLRTGLDMRSFDPKKEADIGRTIEARREQWLQDQAFATQSSMVAAGFIMPESAFQGSAMERIRATTDLAAGFFASLQGPGVAGMPSGQDVFTGRRAREAAELADPRVSPGFVLSPEIKASFDRFVAYYQAGNTDAIREAITKGQGGIRTLAESLGAEPRQADAMVTSAQHTATGLFSGPDAKRLALYADSQRSMTIHTVDEYDSWKVGSPAAVRYANVIQNATKAIGGHNDATIGVRQIASRSRNHPGVRASSGTTV